MFSKSHSEDGSPIRNFIVGTCLILSSLCSMAEEANEQMVWQGGYDYVAIVAKDGARNQGNQHPVDISPASIKLMLSSIRVADTDEGIGSKFFGFFSDDDEKSVSDNDFDEEGDRYPALFTDAETRKISTAISRALGRARPHEDIVFSVSGRHEALLGKSQLSTTARVFYSNDGLHLIFGEIYVDISKKYRRKGYTSDVPEKIDHKKLQSFRLKQGQRDSASRLPVRFITDNSHSLFKYDGELRSDWLVIDSNNFNQSLQQQRSNANRSERVSRGPDEFLQKTEVIENEQEQLKRKVDRLERLVEAKEKAAAASAAPAVAKPAATKSLEERLTQLKTLFDKGFVSEELYNEKVRKLLEEL